MLPFKASAEDLMGRFREVISDPLNLLIDRVPLAGVVEGNDVYLHNGIKVPVMGEEAYYGLFSHILVLNRGVHEPLEEYVFQEVLKGMTEAPLMIELGAYWAHYSMWLKKVRPQATVFMVEPDPVHLAAGRKNFQRNGFAGEFILAAVGNGQWQLDTFLQSRGIAHVNILHVDIQGFEIDLFRGGSTALKQAMVDGLFVSTHSQYIHQQIIDLLSQHDYRVEVASDFDNDTTSFDGLVFASSPKVKPVFRDFVTFGRTKIAAGRADDLVEAILRGRASAI